MTTGDTTASGRSVHPQARPRIYLVAPRFPPSYWGLEHFIALTPYDAVFPPLGLLTLAALTPAEFSRLALRRERRRDGRLRHRRRHRRRSPATSSRWRACSRSPIDSGRAARRSSSAGRWPTWCPRSAGRTATCSSRARPSTPGRASCASYAAGRHADHYVEAEKIHLPDSPPPRLDVLNSRYAHGIVQCTRGCPFTCEFCDIIVMYGRKMRFKPVEQVIQEVEAWHRRGAAQVFFADDNFVGNRAYAKELLRALIAWNSQPASPAVVLHPGQHRHGARRGAAGTAARRELHLGVHRHRVAAQGEPGRDAEDPERADRPGRRRSTRSSRTTCSSRPA